MTKCYLDNHVSGNKYDIQIDTSNETISYTYIIHFKGSDKHPAILLRTSDENLLFFFLQKVYGQPEVNNLKKAMNNALWGRLSGVAESKKNFQFPEGMSFES